MDLKDNFEQIFKEIENNLLAHNYEALGQNVSKLIALLDSNKGAIDAELANNLMPRIQNVLNRLQIFKDNLSDSLSDIERTLKLLDKYEN
jgi:archaellum component FlaC